MTPQAGFDVDLVVPVRDEEASIETLAASIAAQTMAPSSVVFVDGGSVDRTVEILRVWAARHATWRVIEAGPATPGRGRNVGIENTGAPWIALADAGMTLDRHWLGRLVDVARREPAAGVIYGQVDVSTRGFVERCAALVYAPPLRPSDRGPVREPVIACALLRRDAWERVGGFRDLRAAEDGIFMRELLQHGVSSAVAPEARIVWQLERTFGGTFRRLRMYSRVNVHAGEQAYWHHGVARHWLITTPFLVAGVRRPRLLAIPALSLVARAIRASARGRDGRSIVWVANPVRLAGVGAVLLTCDLATFAGWFDAVRDRFHGRVVTG